MHTSVDSIIDDSRLIGECEATLVLPRDYPAL